METVGPEIANEVLSWLRGAGDLVAQEAPLLARDIVRWHFWLHLTAAMLSGVVLAVFVALFCICFRSWLSSQNDKQAREAYAAGIFVFGAVAALMLIPATTMAMQCVKAAVAPRVVIVEQMARLVR